MTDANYKSECCDSSVTQKAGEEYMGQDTYYYVCDKCRNACEKKQDTIGQLMDKGILEAPATGKGSWSPGVPKKFKKDGIVCCNGMEIWNISNEDHEVCGKCHNIFPGLLKEDYVIGTAIETFKKLNK